VAARTPPSVDLVRDLCQEIFLRTFQALPAFSLRSSFTTWLFKLTRNRVLDELRALERRQRRATTYEHDAIRTVDPPSERLELLDAIWRAIGTLNGDLRWRSCSAISSDSPTRRSRSRSK
jgi:RNA polymerase sigma factor (sigma-70 family)